MIDFALVRPCEVDARLLMEWRNDPLTRKMSFHQELKIGESFFQEFLQEYFSFDELPPLFILWNKERVGFLRFRPIPHPTGRLRTAADISIIIAPSYRGKGIGTKALLELLTFFKATDDLFAEVKKENTASQKIFEEAGFIRLQDGIKEVDDHSFPICRYIYEIKPEAVEEQVFIIAEAGSNWRAGSLRKDKNRAKALIDGAKEAGCNAVKFQIFRPETIYVQNAGLSDYLSDFGFQEDMQTLFQNLSMPYDMMEELARYCDKMAIEFMATPFSPVDFFHVNPLVQRHKIASYEIGHIRLLELAAKSLKPIILSVGAASEEEIAWAVSTLRKYSKERITLLQCTAKYPADPSTLHLRTIPWLKKRFHLSVGLSDHSRHPTAAPVAAVSLGAKVIEKHFTLDNRLKGPDHAFAVTPAELKELVTAVRQAEEMLGSSVKVVDPSEEELRSFARRGLQAIQEIKKGEIFEEDKNFAILRPGKQRLGLHPRYLFDMEGKKSTRPIPIGDGIQKGDF